MKYNWIRWDTSILFNGPSRRGNFPKIPWANYIAWIWPCAYILSQINYMFILQFFYRTERVVTPPRCGKLVPPRDWSQWLLERTIVSKIHFAVFLHPLRNTSEIPLRASLLVSFVPCDSSVTQIIDDGVPWPLTHSEFKNQKKSEYIFLRIRCIKNCRLVRLSTFLISFTNDELLDLEAYAQARKWMKSIRFMTSLIMISFICVSPTGPKISSDKVNLKISCRTTFFFFPVLMSHRWQLSIFEVKRYSM